MDGEPFNLVPSEGVGSEPFDVTITRASQALMLAAPDAGLSGGKGSALVGVERALQAGLISLQQRDALLKEL